MGGDRGGLQLAGFTCRLTHGTQADVACVLVFMTLHGVSFFCLFFLDLLLPNSTSLNLVECR